MPNTSAQSKRWRQVPLLCNYLVPSELHPIVNGYCSAWQVAFFQKPHDRLHYRATIDCVVYYSVRKIVHKTQGCDILLLGVGEAKEMRKVPFGAAGFFSYDSRSLYAQSFRRHVERGRCRRVDAERDGTEKSFDKRLREVHPRPVHDRLEQRDRLCPRIPI